MLSRVIVVYGAGLAHDFRRELMRLIHPLMNLFFSGNLRTCRLKYSCLELQMIRAFVKGDFDGSVSASRLNMRQAPIPGFTAASNTARQ